MLSGTLTTLGESQHLRAVIGLFTDVLRLCSWGATRLVEGETAEKGHGDKDGVFDSSHIVMKRWVEFERERRWKNGQQSRDSYTDVIYRTTGGR